MSYLTEVCAELRGRLRELEAAEETRDTADAGIPADEVLMAEHGTVAGGFVRGSQASSKVPGNVAAMMLSLDVHEFVRRLEASLRLAVAGHPGKARGGSEANTISALRAIANLGEALDEDKAAEAGRLLERFVVAIGQLPALDDVPRWEKIRPGPGGLPPKCPHCQTYSLRVSLQSGAVMCVFPGCEDADGRRPPQARMEINKVDGRPVLVWRDGLVQ